ncbi:MAG TPA: hypothetical protein VHK88_20395 [Aquihabitans sp.]|nr:hypothetical protein [Aquihabitans sp.]
MASPEALLVALGASPGAARSVADELAARHGEPHRRHHSLEHVGEVLAEVDRLLPTEPDADGTAVRLAAWFHDAIHDPTDGPGVSEAASAELAVDRLPALALADRDRLADEVARLVRLTATHRTEAVDRSGAVLLDADLWILSSPPERYDRYVAEVRAEYGHVGDAAWVAGRGSLLAGFLARADELYGAGAADDRRARRARAVANLQRELAALRPG